MIMPCINSTSFADAGGNVPLVEGGSVLVGLPGAPGWTIAGVCWAQTGSENMQATKAISIRNDNLKPMLTRKDFIGTKPNQCSYESVILKNTERCFRE